jgi:PEP-CTERM motif
LYLYSQNSGFANDATVFTLGSSSMTVATTQDESTFISGTNFTEFTNITLDALGSISFSYQGQSSGGEGDFNGLQLVEVSAAPEPSTWAMLFGGLGVLVISLRLSRTRAGFNL